ncbi:MAG TPA: hypothetical protein VE057_04490 [Archangium sp.]|jgi:hypothetical protein|nr:hypothetical protein [Archangium sp.]
MLQLQYQFSSEDAARLAGSPIPFTFITAIENRLQAPRCCTLAPHVATARGPFLVEGTQQWEASVEVARLLGLPAGDGPWILHASILHYRSGMLALQFGG